MGAARNAANVATQRSRPQGLLKRPQVAKRLCAMRLPVVQCDSDHPPPANSEVAAIERPRLEPIDTSFSFKNKAYAALKSVIVGMDVYGSASDIRLDERSLAEEFGISRTPVREAMAQLEREGFVRSVPRRGVYVVRKTKREVIETDHRLGGARKHGGAADHRERQRRRDRLAAAHVRHLRERRSARASRRIFRGQYRVSSDYHPLEPQQRADRSSPRTCSPICG